VSSKKSRHKIAVGLYYNEQEADAPTIGVKGEQLIADEIVKIAERFNIPVVNDRALAKALKATPLDEEVPEDLYRAVAIVLGQIEEKVKEISQGA